MSQDMPPDWVWGPERRPNEYGVSFNINYGYLSVVIFAFVTAFCASFIFSMLCILWQYIRNRHKKYDPIPNVSVSSFAGIPVHIISRYQTREEEDSFWEMRNRMPFANGRRLLTANGKRVLMRWTSRMVVATGYGSYAPLDTIENKFKVVATNTDRSDTVNVVCESTKVTVAKGFICMKIAGYSSPVTVYELYRQPGPPDGNANSTLVVGEREGFVHAYLNSQLVGASEASSVYPIPVKVGANCDARFVALAISLWRTHTWNNVLCMILVGINVVIFVASMKYSSIVYLGVKDNRAIQSGQLWRLITPTLLHGSWGHLIGNSFGIFEFGGQLESWHSNSSIVLLYLWSGLVGGTFSFLFNPRRSLGASDAVFGLYGANLVFKIRHWTILRQSKMGVWTILLIALWNFFTSSGPEIDVAAHLGGLVGGIMFGVLFGPRYFAGEKRFGETLVFNKPLFSSLWKRKSGGSVESEVKED